MRSFARAEPREVSTKGATPQSCYHSPSHALRAGRAALALPAYRRGNVRPGPAGEAAPTRARGRVHLLLRVAEGTLPAGGLARQRPARRPPASRAGPQPGLEPARLA